MNCFICGDDVESTVYTRYKFKSTGRVYCSKKCSSEYSATVSSATMATTNKKYASNRMKVNNPMQSYSSREKMISSLKSIEHKPSVRGGNGAFSVQQVALSEKLGWPMEVAVPTGRRIPGQPTCYKLDIGDSELKIGVEVDGHSHFTPLGMARDARKEAFLSALGWRVIHFRNEEVDADIDHCAFVVRSVSCRP